MDFAKTATARLPKDPVTYEELFVFVQAIAKASYPDARMDAHNIVDVARGMVKRGMSSKPDPKEMKELRAKVAAATDGRPNLSEFLNRISHLHPALEAAISGTYSGDEGRAVEPIADWGVSLVFGWYSNDHRKHFVEFSYIS
jgi:hypothetical protein